MKAHFAILALLIAVAILPAVAAFSENFESPCVDQGSPILCTTTGFTFTSSSGGTATGCGTTGTTGSNVDGTQGYPGPGGQSYRMGSTGADCVARWRSSTDWGGFPAGATACTGAAGEVHGVTCGYLEKCGGNTASFNLKMTSNPSINQGIAVGLGGNLDPANPNVIHSIGQLQVGQGLEFLGVAKNQYSGGASAQPFTTAPGGHIFATVGVWYSATVGPICNVSDPVVCPDGGTGPNYPDRTWRTFKLQVPITVSGGDLSAPATRTFVVCLGGFSVNPTGYLDSFTISGPGASGTAFARVDNSGFSVVVPTTVPTVDAGSAIPAFGKDIGYASVVGQFLFGLVLVVIFFLVMAGAFAAITNGAPGATWAGTVGGVGMAIFNALSGIWVSDIAIALLLLTAAILAVLIRKLIWGRSTGAGGTDGK